LVKVKNENLENENQVLKGMKKGEAEIKGRETNLPMAISDSPLSQTQKNQKQSFGFKLDSGREPIVEHNRTEGS
jgi:hypothetical protein